MVEKITPTTAALREKVQRVVDDLWKFYPDGKITSLQAEHKGLANRLGEVWKEIGYQSREDFLSAYGLEFVYKTGSQGGRPPTFDPDELLAELEMRYEGVEKPSAVGILMFENPDLKGNIKTLQNKATELYGKSFGQVLVERGILGSSARVANTISDDDIRAMVVKLKCVYADSDKRVSTVAALKRLHPEYKAEFAAFTGRCEILYGKTPKNLLIEKGILALSKDLVMDAGDEEINEAIRSLGEAICGLPEEKKPKTLTDLQEKYPQYKELIKVGKQKGLIDKEFMQTLGILRPTKALFKRICVRNAEVGSLAADYLSVADDALITPDGDSGLLPPFVAGIDVNNKVELCETIIFASDAGAKLMKVGVEFGVRSAKVSKWWGSGEFGSLEVMSSPPHILESAYAGKMFERGEEPLESSPLDSYAKAAVLSVVDDLAKLRVRYIAPLRRETLAYVLRAMGYVDKDDARGNMAWRFRLWKAQMDGVEPEPNAVSARAAAGNEDMAEDAGHIGTGQPESAECPDEAASPAESPEKPETAVEDDEERSKCEVEEGERKRIAEEEKHRVLEEARKKAEEDRLRKEAEEAERRRLEEERRKAEEEACRAKEEAARKEKEKFDLAKKKIESFAKLIEANEEKLEAAKCIESTPSEKRAANLTKELAKMRKEFEGLGIFAFSRKKELTASIQAKAAEFEAVKARIPAEKKAADDQREKDVSAVEAELKKLREEAAPYIAVVSKNALATLSGAEVGETIQFGNFPQDSGSATPTPIEWRVLEDEDGVMLLLSTKVLDRMKFNADDSRGNNYAHSDLRDWMKGTFAPTAFDASERLLLDGEPFVLDVNTFEKHFPTPGGRQCGATPYAVSKGANRDRRGMTFFWLATPYGSKCSCFVNPSGYIMGKGGDIYVLGIGSVDCIGQEVYYESGVRPAIRVKANL